MTRLEKFFSQIWERFGFWTLTILISYFSLPIEGEFWASLMPTDQWHKGYALCFTLDMAAAFLVYRRGRIHQSVRKGSKKWKAARLILAFIVLNAVAGWGTSAWQIHRVLVSPTLLFALAFAIIQPVMNFGLSYAQAVQDGKYDEPQTEERETKSDAQKQGEFKSKQLMVQRNLPTEVERTVLDRDGWHCFYCGADLHEWPANQVHIDHFVPVSKGGSDVPNNLVVSCSTCNLRKRDKLPTEEQIEKFKAHLVTNSEYTSREKIFLLHSLDNSLLQKDIAQMVGVSASYVSSVVGDAKDLREREDVLNLIQELNLVGQLPEMQECKESVQ